MAEAARRIVRRATAQLSFERIIADSRDALLEGFRAAGMWLQTFDQDGHGEIYSADGREIALGPELVAIAEASARQAWEEQSAVVVAHDRTLEAITEEQGRLILSSSTASASSRCCSPRSAPAPSAWATSCSPGSPGRRSGPSPSHRGARHRARPGPCDPQRPHLRARAPARGGAAGARHLQGPADRHGRARAEEPAHLGDGPPEMLESSPTCRARP